VRITHPDDEYGAPPPMASAVFLHFFTASGLSNMLKA
jgi:hypothetical protein